MKKKYSPTRWDIRCDYCGRFISNQDFNDNKVDQRDVIDSWYGTHEDTVFWHKRCEEIFEVNKKFLKEMEDEKAP